MKDISIYASFFYFQWPKCWLARKPGWTPAIPFSCNHCLGSDPNHANCPLQPHNPWWLQHQHHNVLHQLHATTSRLPWQPDAETWLWEPCSIPEKQLLPLSKVRKGITFRIRPFNSKIIFLFLTSTKTYIFKWAISMNTPNKLLTWWIRKYPKFLIWEVHHRIFGRKFSLKTTHEWSHKTWFPTVYLTIYLPKWKFWIWLSPF